MPIYRNGVDVGETTSIVTSGSEEFVYTPNAILVGENAEDAIDTIVAGLVGSKAIFIEDNGGVSYFTNVAIGSSLVPFGALFVGLRAKGTAGAETAVQATDYLGAMAFSAYDGSAFSFNSSGANIFPGFWGKALSNASADTFDSEFYIGGFATPAIHAHLMNAGGNKLGFFGATPVVQPAAYTPTNVVADRSYDADATTTAELADVLGTLIADLQLLGLVA